jgi:pilus assembly protein CpaE
VTTIRRVLVVDRRRDVASALAESWSSPDDPEVSHLARTTRLNAVVAREGPWDAIVAGASEERLPGLRRLARLRQEWPDLPVLLVGSGRETPDAQALVQARPDELLRPPVSPDGLRAAVERIVEARMATDTLSTHAGTVHVVLGPNGGAGRTTIAVALADLLARGGDSVALVDASLQFGAVASALRVPRAPRITDVLTDERGRPQPVDAVAESLADGLETVHGVRVLAAPSDPVEADRVTPEELGLVLGLLREQVEHVIVDCPAGLGAEVLTSLDLADRVLVVSSADVPAAASLRSFLEVLDQLGIADERVHVIVNKELPGSGLDAADVAEVLGRPVFSIAFDEEFPRAMNDGIPASRAASSAASAVQTALGMHPPPPPSVTERQSGWMARGRTWLEGLLHAQVVTEDRS